jgi:hypothetical protein
MRRRPGGSVAYRPDGRNPIVRFFALAAQVRFDRRRIDRQGERAMTTATLSRAPSSPIIGLAGAFAFIISVVVLILPH